MATKRKLDAIAQDFRENLASPVIDGEFSTWTEARDHFDRVIRFCQDIEAQGLNVEIEFNVSMKMKSPRND